MKSLCFVLAIALLSLSLAVAQSDAHQSSAPPAEPKPGTQSDAQQSFDKLKTLAGAWEGILTTVPPEPDVDGKVAQVSLRVTSSGNAITHEATSPARPDDPLTVLYVDGDRLLLTHYCDAGNRPRMVARTASDGKTVEFDFLDLSGGNEYGHMHHAVFTLVNADHHLEDWIYMMPGDKPVHAHFDLSRKK